MTLDELARQLSAYRDGLDAELAILRQLQAVSAEQGDASRTATLDAFHALADERDRLMHNLLSIEETLRSVRQTLADHRALASRLEGYEEVAARHREAARLVGMILAADRASLEALADAEIARRSAAAGLERGEATLAAYRRVLTPTASGATLLNRRG